MLRRLGYELCAGRCIAILPASSMDVYLGYVLLSTVPVAPSKGPFVTDLNDPVNSDGDTGGAGETSLVVVGAAGLLGGDVVRGSRVMLPVSNSGPGRLFWLVALPDVLGRGLVRSNSDCWSGVETSPSLLRFCTLEAMVDVSSISSVPSKAGPLMDISSSETEIADSKSAVSPDKTDPTEVTISANGPRGPAPGSLVNATFMVAVMSRSRVPIGFRGNQSTSLIGNV